MRQTKVIHVHLTGKRRDLYFASIAAILLVLSPQEVGCGYDYLRRAGLSGGGTVVTKRAYNKAIYAHHSPSWGAWWRRWLNDTATLFEQPWSAV